jgi:hypothetical protein
MFSGLPEAHSIHPLGVRGRTLCLRFAKSVLCYLTWNYNTKTANAIPKDVMDRSPCE